MLQIFRRHAYSWTTRILLLLLGGVFAIFFTGMSGYFLRVKPVAAVDCHSLPLGLFTLPGCHNILADDVDSETADLRRTIQNVYGANAGAVLQNVNLRQMALEQLIEDSLIEREARRLGVSISDEELARTIESQSAFQADGRFDVALYNQILRGNALEPATFENSTRVRMLTDTLRQMVTDGISVSHDEARRAYNRIHEKFVVSYIEFPYANFAAAVQPTEAEIGKFYAENKADFRQPDQIKLLFVRYDPAAMGASATPAQSEIDEYYQRNLKDQFTHPDQARARHILIAVATDAPAAQQAAAKAKAEDILNKLKAGGDFAQLARQYSEDPGTKERGGELGYFSRGEMVKPFEDAAFKMKPGQLQLVQSQFGFHIIQLEDLKPAHIDSPEEALPRITAALKLKMGKEAAGQAADQDVTAALIGHDLNELAKKRGLTAVETPYFTATDQVKGAEEDPKFAAEVFKFKSGDIRSITDGPQPYLVKVIDRKAARLPALSEIKDQVRDTLVRMTAESKAHDAATALLKQIESASAFDTVAAANHLEVHTTAEFPRMERAVPGLGPFPEVTEAAATTAPLPGVVARVLESGGNSFIFKVDSRQAPSDEEWKTQSAGFTEQMAQQQRATAWASFINELKRHATIEIDTEQLGESAPAAPSPL